VTTNPKTIAADLAISALSSKPLASDLAKKFAEAGFTLALVGGPVRDAILGRLGNDLDFTTNAKPDETKSIIKKVQIRSGKLAENSEPSPRNLVM
jgi:poly(A) polymerase